MSEADECQVFIGNLSWDVSWQDLKDHVNGIVGDVERADVMTEPGGRSKGSGMVKFANAEAAQRAIDELNETDFNGRTIFVRADRGGSGKGGGGPVRSGGRGGRDRPAPYGGKGGKGGKGGGRGGKGGGRGGKREERSAADLDNDLDAYMSKKGNPDE